MRKGKGKLRLVDDRIACHECEKLTANIGVVVYYSDDTGLRTTGAFCDVYCAASHLDLIAAAVMVQEDGVLTLDSARAWLQGHGMTERARLVAMYAHRMTRKNGKGK